MGTGPGLKIVIASAGRRAHYVEWFQDALRSQHLSGEVIAMEYRASSPTLSLADVAVVTPAYNDPGYHDMVRDWCARERPDLFLSLNDYELQVLSGPLAEQLRSLGCAVTSLDPDAQAIVLDKHRMATVLAAHGIPTPRTWLGGQVEEIRRVGTGDGRFLVKHRFGSGSTGLQFATTADLDLHVMSAARTALGPDGRQTLLGPDAVVVQEFLPGAEHGVDGVFAVDGSSRLLGVLARRKDQMRGGDTDVATTVSAAPFEDAIRRLGELLRPTGAIDVDLRDTADGQPQVIDINPRLGGGYPFCHRAGADLPAALLRSVAGLEHDPSLLRCELGITTARREEFTVLSARSHAAPVLHTLGH